MSSNADFLHCVDHVHRLCRFKDKSAAAIKKVRCCINVWLSNLLKALKGESDIVIPGSRDYWNNKKNYKVPGNKAVRKLFVPYKYRVWRKVRDRLEQLGYLSMVEDSFFNEFQPKYNRCRKYIGTELLKGYFERSLIDTTYAQVKAISELRGLEEQKTITGLSKDDIAKVLQNYDNLVHRHKLTLNGKVITPKLRCIYKEGPDYALHGRCYLTDIGLTAKDRLNIKCNGQDMAEVDFSSMHINIMYDQLGFKCPEDPLQIKGYEWMDRKVVKSIFYRILNSKSKKQTIAALNFIRPVKDYNSLLVHNAEMSSQIYIRNNEINVEDFIDCLEKQHREISRFFFTEYSNYLMTIDAAIMTNIMKNLTAQNINFIPVHDSVLVPESATKYTQVLMEQEYNTVMQHISQRSRLYTINTKVKSNNIEVEEKIIKIG